MLFYVPSFTHNPDTIFNFLKEIKILFHKIWSDKCEDYLYKLLHFVSTQTTMQTQNRINIEKVQISLKREKINNEQNPVLLSYFYEIFTQQEMWID